MLLNFSSVNFLYTRIHYVFNANFVNAKGFHPCCRLECEEAIVNFWTLVTAPGYLSVCRLSSEVFTSLFCIPCRERERDLFNLRAMYFYTGAGAVFCLCAYVLGAVSEREGRAVSEREGRAVSEREGRARSARLWGGGCENEKHRKRYM